MPPQRRAACLPAESIAGQLARAGCAIVATAISADDGPREPSGDGWCRAAAAVTAAVAALVPRLTIAVFGGDTAYSVCRALGYAELFPIDEILPGLTVCSAPAAAGKTVILKSGGFGPPDVVDRIRAYIARRIPASERSGEAPG